MSRVADAGHWGESDFNKMLAVSIGLHVIAVATYLVIDLTNRRPPLVQNAIQTRLVKLGQVKPDWLPRVATTPPPAKAPAVPIATEAKAIALPKEPVPTKDEKRFDNALKRLDDLEKHQPDDYKGKGDPRGSKAGQVSDFTMQTLGMQYANDVDARIRPNWIVPSVIPEDTRAGLSAVVLINIAADGKVLQVTLEKKSGNSLYDEALLKAIQQSSPLPIPPTEIRKQVANDGLEIEFSGKR